jgi:hypothetical protein
MECLVDSCNVPHVLFLDIPTPLKNGLECQGKTLNYESSSRELWRIVTVRLKLMEFLMEGAEGATFLIHVSVPV